MLDDKLNLQSIIEATHIHTQMQNTTDLVLYAKRQQQMWKKNYRKSLSRTTVCISAHLFDLLFKVCIVVV